MGKSNSSYRFPVTRFRLLFIACYLLFVTEIFAQPSNDLEFTLDVSTNTVSLPKIFKPNIDLSGRGLNPEISWPQTVAAKDVLERWQKDIGFASIYRIQYNLWDIVQLEKDKESQGQLIANYKAIMKNITDAGGIVIVNIFGTPAGLGQVLDKKSPPRDLAAFKKLIKSNIRELSCNKRYNIWYEVWNAPDLDDFFLGRKQEYLSLYKIVAESAKELEAETKIHIPIGGPSVSWWFQAVDGNTIATPEKSLIYELIRFCYKYQLPIDFISWHAFTTDPQAEKESSIYKKTAVKLIRDWLSYFNFDRNTPLIVDEWNYDRDANVLPARAEKSFISASYIPSRLKNMFEAGIDYQVYFCLEDFNDNKDGVVRNVGLFSFDAASPKELDASKATYSVFRMLSSLGGSLFASKLEDPFVGVIASKTTDGIVMLVYNYIDPDISANFISKNIANLSPAERKALLAIIKSDKLEKALQGVLDISKLRVRNNVKNILKKARELNDLASRMIASERNIKISVKNLNPQNSKLSQATKPPDSNQPKENYIYQKYLVDSSCSYNCEFSPVEEKEVFAEGTYQEIFTLKPYSVQMIVFKKKPIQAQPEEPVIEKNTQTDAGKE